MSNNLHATTSNIIDGLGTYTHTAGLNAMYNVAVKSTITPASGLIITIAQTGSTSVSISSPAPSPTQNHVDLQNLFNCVSGDTLTITLSSSTPIDTQLNTISSQVTIQAGAV